MLLASTKGTDFDEELPDNRYFRKLKTDNILKFVITKSLIIQSENWGNLLNVLLEAWYQTESENQTCWTDTSRFNSVS